MALAATTIIPFDITKTQDNTNTIETRRRHAIEKHEKNLMYVQALEIQLGITVWWMVESAEFQSAAQMVAMRVYQRALDVLKGLVVAQLFELTSMNRSQMGTSLLLPEHVYLN